MSFINGNVAGLSQLSDTKDHFLTYVGAWASAKECCTGENRKDGTVYYYQDGLYWYEFQNREDAFKYLFNGERDMPYALREYDDELSDQNGEESFSDWEYHNFPTLNKNN